MKNESENPNHKKLLEVAAKTQFIKENAINGWRHIIDKHRHLIERPEGFLEVLKDPSSKDYDCVQRMVGFAIGLVACFHAARKGVYAVQQEFPAVVVFETLGATDMGSTIMGSVEFLKKYTKEHGEMPTPQHFVNNLKSDNEQLQKDTVGLAQCATSVLAFIAAYMSGNPDDTKENEVMVVPHPGSNEQPKPKEPKIGIDLGKDPLSHN